LAVGKDASCALESNAATCWGRDINNKLDVPALTNPIYISVGYEHSCAVADEGLVCWGAGSENGGNDLNYG